MVLVVLSVALSMVVLVVLSVAVTVVVAVVGGGSCGSDGCCR